MVDDPVVDFSLGTHMEIHDFPCPMCATVLTAAPEMTLAFHVVRIFKRSGRFIV